MLSSRLLASVFKGVIADVCSECGRCGTMAKVAGALKLIWGLLLLLFFVHCMSSQGEK